MLKPSNKPSWIRVPACLLGALLVTDLPSATLRAQSGPNGAVAQCTDGSFVFTWTERTCAYNGGVARRFTGEQAPRPSRAVDAPAASVTPPRAVDITPPETAKPQPEKKAGGMKWWEWALVGVIAAAGGYAAYQAGKAGAVAPTTPAVVPPVGSSGVGLRLLVFGGTNGTVYLGCLNCSALEADSIQNTLGTYGNRFSPTSLFNQFGDYASRFSDLSACNPLAQHPPRLVDDRGGYYGVLSSNASLPGRTRVPAAVALLAGLCQ